MSDNLNGDSNFKYRQCRDGIETTMVSEICSV